MDISVVIPTCNRRQRLLSLLGNLNGSGCPVLEVIIVDSGEDKLTTNDYTDFKNLHIHYLESEKSVCIQRNTGIKKAAAPWIFLCDDDIEVPAGYLQNLVDHIAGHEDAGAVSGLFLQDEKTGYYYRGRNAMLEKYSIPGNTGWTAQYPVYSAKELLWKFVFQLSIWGEINCRNNNWLFRRIKNYYRQKGNHISKAGWPVLTDFSGDWFITPVYSLGASLVRKDWLLQSPFDEVLDKHGMGDNYGVAAGFPSAGIHIVNNAFVYHHREPMNRLKRPLQYSRRVLALDYFIATKKKWQDSKKSWLLWSLTGNLLNFILVWDSSMFWPSLKSMGEIALGKNPYSLKAKENQKPVQ